MPGPFSWYFHHLPRAAAPGRGRGQPRRPARRAVAPLRAPAGGRRRPRPSIIVTQLWLVAVRQLRLAELPHHRRSRVRGPRQRAGCAPSLPRRPAGRSTGPAGYATVVLAVAVAVVVLSYWPARNLLSPRQAMNASFNRLHLVNAYGAFGSVTRERHEVIVEGTADAAVGRTPSGGSTSSRASPATPRRRPGSGAPYHLRLDWLMWFAALSPATPTVVPRLPPAAAAGDRATLRLVRHNPFPDRPPALVRARLYHYRFTHQRRAPRHG